MGFNVTTTTPSEIKVIVNQDLVDSVIEAGQSADNAEASANSASASAQTATTQAGIATTQAGIATTQAGIATTQAGIATTQAGIATNQAGIATTQAGVATTKANEASQSAIDADVAKDAAVTAQLEAENILDQTVMKNTLFKKASNFLILEFLTGYYNTTATSLASTLIVGGALSTKVYECVQGDIFSVSVLPTSGTCGKLVNASGTFVKNLLFSDFTLVNGRLQITINVAGTVGIIFTVLDANLSLFNAFGPTDVIKDNFYYAPKIQEIAESSSQIVKGSDIYSTAERILFPVWLNGYYQGVATNIFSTIIVSTVYQSSELIPCLEGDVFKLLVAASAFAPTSGKFVNSSGTFVKNLVPSDFTLVDGMYQITINVAGTVGLILTLAVSAQSALELRGPGDVINPVLLPEPILPYGAVAISKIPLLSQVREFSKNISDTSRSYLFKKGGNARVSQNVIDCILIAGQSNADGRAAISGAPSWLTTNSNKLDSFLIWNRISKEFQSFQLEVNTGAENNLDSRHAFDLYIAKNYIDEFSKPIYGIKCTLGGTSIATNVSAPGYWNVNYESFAVGKRKLLIETAERVREALDYAELNNLILNFRAIIWHQGETDNQTTAAANYENNFKDVIAYLRGIVMNPLCPIIFGMIPNASIAYNATVRSAQESIAASDPNSYLVDLSELTLFDGGHFDASQAQIAGNRYWAILETLL